MKVLNVEQHQINKTHPVFKIIDDFCIRSKNLYNYANYIHRHEFFEKGKHVKYCDMQNELKTHDPYKQLMSQASQCTLQVLDRNWKSFFESTKDYKNNPSKYLGEPKIPKYKKKDGRFAWYLKNNQTYINNGKLYFRLKVFNGYGFTTSVTDRLISVRFIPRGTIYVMEIVYEVFVPDVKSESSKICSIDLGINNFATMTNNIGLQPIIINGKGLKSINQFYNKSKAKLQSDLMKRNKIYYSNKLYELDLKRFNRVKNFMHHSSRLVIDFCVENGVDTLIVGLNKKWKQNCNMGSKTNQKFVYIPFNMFLKQLEYKCQNHGIRFMLTEESYTSGTSFLDGELPCKDNYDKSRRIKRGLFQSQDRLINSDVNGSLQIMRKVFPDAISYGIEGSLTPVIINVVKTM